LGLDGSPHGAVQVSLGFGYVGLDADFTAPGADEVGLALEHQEDGGRSGLELALFARVLLFGGLAGERGGGEARFGGDGGLASLEARPQ
jgi:hypothetical protein